jgi:colanic acid/amylovoran biosynthesis glycosyltransferase
MANRAHESTRSSYLGRSAMVCYFGVLSMPEAEPIYRRGLDRAAVFTRKYLPYSQTFIHDELRHHRRYEAEVFTGEVLNLERFPFGAVHGDSARTTLWTRTDGRIRDAVYYSREHERAIASGGFSVLHAHFGLAAPFALPYRVRLGIPLIVTFHGFDAGVLAKRWRWGRWRYRALAPVILRLTTRFLAASEELAEILVRAGAPEARVHVWRVGIVLPDRATLPDNERRVIMVGRFVEKKGFRYGLEAFARVAELHPEVELDVIGAGPLEADLRARVERLGVASRVTFHRSKPHHEVLDRIARAAVLLAPSVESRRGDRESGLVVVKEAGARCVPSVASRHGGIPEIIRDGETGYLVEERDVDGLADRLDRLLGDDAHRRGMGEAARLDMEERYEVQTRVDELECHYDEVRQEARRW